MPGGLSLVAKFMGCACFMLSRTVSKIGRVDLVFSGLNAKGPASDTHALIIDLDRPSASRKCGFRAIKAAICAPAECPISIIFDGFVLGCWR